MSNMDVIGWIGVDKNGNKLSTGSYAKSTKIYSSEAKAKVSLYNAGHRDFKVIKAFVKDDDFVRIPTPREILACSMQENDAGAGTIGEYLITLLHSCWAQQESFSGKRPFGNSGWSHELFAALVMGGLLEGTYDENYAYDFDEKLAHSFINSSIDELFKIVDNVKNSDN